MKNIFLLNALPDKLYLQILYYYHFHKFINFRNPTLFNEKMQWLKLYDYRKEYDKMVDKISAKDYVARIIGDQYIIKTLNAWKNVDEIDFDSLPAQFVLKCSHNSGGMGVVICKDRKCFDIEKAKQNLKKALKKNDFWYGRERPYKNIKPMIFAEPYLEDEKTHELRDYKFFCFNGIVKALFIATDRQKKGESVKFDFFDEEFKHLPFTNGHPNASICPQKPSTFDEMKQIAERLSKGMPFIRVDLYEVNGRVFFGELTLYHGSGCLPFVPEEWNHIFGEWLFLPKK